MISTCSEARRRLSGGRKTAPCLCLALERPVSSPADGPPPGHCPEDCNDCICRGAVPSADIRVPGVDAISSLLRLHGLVGILDHAPAHSLAHLTSDGSPTGLAGWGDAVTVRAILQNFRCRHPAAPLPPAKPGRETSVALAHRPFPGPHHLIISPPPGVRYRTNALPGRKVECAHGSGWFPSDLARTLFLVYIHLMWWMTPEG